MSKVSFTGLNSRCWQGCDTSEVAEETDNQFLAFSSFYSLLAICGISGLAAVSLQLLPLPSHSFSACLYFWGPNFLFF